MIDWLWTNIWTAGFWMGLVAGFLLAHYIEAKQKV
jgi:hypothetical protein